MSDFETKVENELQWLPKAIEKWEKVSDDGFNQAYLCPRDKHRFLLYCPLTGQLYYKFQLDRKAFKHRIGGPAYYCIVDGKIRDMRYYLYDNAVSAVDYWLYVWNNFKDEFETQNVYKKGCHGPYKMEILSLNGFPTPTDFYAKSDTLVWKVRGKRVSQSSYWKYRESIHAPLDKA